MGTYITLIEDEHRSTARYLHYTGSLVQDRIPRYPDHESVGCSYPPPLVHRQRLAVDRLEHVLVVLYDDYTRVAASHDEAVVYKAKAGLSCVRVLLTVLCLGPGSLHRRDPQSRTRSLG